MSSADFLRSQGSETVDGAIDLDCSLDSVLTLLSDHRRRAVLYVLSESSNRELFVVDLAQKVALLEETTDDIETVLTKLTHAHLPQIAAAGIIEYDEQAKMVRYTGDERVEQFLESTREIECPE